MTLREPYVPKQSFSKTAEELIYLFSSILEKDEEKVNRGGAPFIYLEDDILVVHGYNRLVNKIDKMEKALEGYRDGKWAKEALE